MVKRAPYKGNKIKVETLVKKMIEDELRFRNEGLSFNKMIDVFKGGA